MKEAAQAYVSWLWIIRPASSHYFLARLTLSQEGALAVLCACLTHLSPGEQSTCGKSSIIPVGEKWTGGGSKKGGGNGDKGGETKKHIPGVQTNQNRGIK